MYYHSEIEQDLRGKVTYGHRVFIYNMISFGYKLLFVDPRYCVSDVLNVIFLLLVCLAFTPEMPWL